jgi:hypothetical protein
VVVALVRPRACEFFEHNGGGVELLWKGHWGCQDRGPAAAVLVVVSTAVHARPTGSDTPDGTIIIHRHHLDVTSPGMHGGWSGPGGGDFNGYDTIIKFCFTPAVYICQYERYVLHVLLVESTY